MVRTGCTLVTERITVRLQRCVCSLRASTGAGFDLLAVSLPRSLVALLLTVRHLGRPSSANKKVSCVRERWILGQDVLVRWAVETASSCPLRLSFGAVDHEKTADCLTAVHSSFHGGLWSYFSFMRASPSVRGDEVFGAVDLFVLF